jgi:hypothetical protein
MQTFASGQHLNVAPDAAAGYIGAPLALDLLDVNALPPDAASTAASPPQLSVQYTSATGLQLPPGLSKKADGSVFVANRTQFGQALAQPWQTDANGTTSQLFAGIARIAPAGATAGSAAPLPRQLFTVKVKAFERSGRAAVDAFADLLNVDNFTTYEGFGAFSGAMRRSASQRDTILCLWTSIPTTRISALTPPLRLCPSTTMPLRIHAEEGHGRSGANKTCRIRSQTPA